MTKIRAAKHEDLDACLQIGKLFHDSSQYAGITQYNPGDFNNHLNYCLKSSGIFFAVVEKNNLIVGFFVATKFPVPWDSSKTVSDEQLFFILPEHSTPRMALRVFRSWENWCRGHKVYTMFFNPTSFILHNLNRWDSFCRVIGFEVSGKSYKKVLRHAD